jgi:hypothetical protein
MTCTMPEQVSNRCGQISRNDFCSLSVVGSEHVLLGLFTSADQLNYGGEDCGTGIWLCKWGAAGFVKPWRWLSGILRCIQ